jgi:hypothetical protein
MCQRTADFLSKNCPDIWALLKERAKRNPPSGFTEFISGPGAAEGRRLLQLAEGRVCGLIKLTSAQSVGDAYRRDLSGVDTEKRLAELLCEMTLANALASISSVPPVFRPPTGGGTESDLKIVIDGRDLYAESKRLADAWEGGKRSIDKSPPGSKKPDADRPRAMDLFSKLKTVFRQLPAGTLNVLFLFHPSTWNTLVYIRQALFGDASRLDDQGKTLVYDDGLYALAEWQEVAACALSRVNCDGTLSIGKLWRNPEAKIALPDAVSSWLSAVR